MLNGTLKNKKKVFLTFVTLWLSLIFLYLLNKGMHNSTKNITSSPLVGKKAPDFSLRSINQIDKSNFALRDFKGQWIVLNFWASWCTSCRAESKVLESFYKKYAKQGAVVLAIATQDEFEDASFVAKKLGKSYKIAMDSKGDTALNYGVTGVPETFIIDKKGVIVYKHVGPITLELLEKHTSEFFATNPKLEEGASHVSNG